MDLEKLAIEAGMESALNMGSGSCVSSFGCNGVTQEHLEKFAALVRAAERERWAAAFTNARDNVLHDRGPLEGAGMDSDQTNAVLAVLDDSFDGLC